MRLSSLALAALMSLGLLLAACDATPGPPPLDARAPVLSGFSYSPAVIVLEQAEPGQVEGGLLNVPIDLSVVARDTDGDLAVVQYVVQAPFAGGEAIASGELAPAGQDRFTARPTVALPTSAVGNYTVLLFATDATGQQSNTVRGLITFEATGQPPVLEDAIVPERVARPGPGEDPVLIPFIAVVSDPDGLGNIARVTMTSVPGGAVFELCDDGGQTPCAGVESGDATAGDGQFTITVQLESTNAPGENTFRFQAVDRTGFESNTITRTITVE